MKKNLTNKRSIKIAVLLATYNGAKYLTLQLNSILSQKNIALDIFISDDNSSDDTAKIISQFSKAHKNIHEVKQLRNKGSANNFYNLIDQVNNDKYSYFAFSDQDDIWPEYKLSRAVNKLIEDDASGYSSDFIYFDETQNFSYYRKSFKQKKYDFLFETPGPGCSFVINKDLFKSFQSFIKNKYDLFDYHDWLIYAYARSHGFLWTIDESPNLFYRQHNDNVVGVNFGIKAYQRRLNRILFGQWFNEINNLTKILHMDKLSTLTKSSLFWFFFRNFWHTRRKLLHSFLMLPFFFLIGIQK
jgi:rhamnosyltransferase